MNQFCFHPNAWLTQQLDRMARGVECGDTRRRSQYWVDKLCDPRELGAAVASRGWRFALVGRSYHFWNPRLCQGFGLGIAA